MATKFRPEEPRIMGPGDRLYSLAERIADWVEDDERMERPWVAGVWGGRGTGKTSLLQTLLWILRARDAIRKHPKTALPEPDETSSSTASRVRAMPRRGRTTSDGADSFEAQDRGMLFEPSFTRDNEELLFMLLRHLDRYKPLYGSESEAERAFHAIRTAEVKRRDVVRFLDYEKEVAVTQQAIIDSHVTSRAAVATSRHDVQREFGCLFSTFAPGKGRPILICVDDLDLRPERALEMLELTHHFLAHSGVIVLIAADRELLLGSIRESLGAHHMTQQSLAGQLLAKFVPYGWALPVPSATERLDQLWSPSDSALPRWWVRDETLTAKAREEAAEALAQLLPRTYRGLVAAHNRLCTLRDELDPAEQGGAPEDIEDASAAAPGNGFTALSDAIRLRFPELDISADNAPFLSGVALADVQLPELGILDVLRFSPRKLIEEIHVYSQPPVTNDGEKGAEKSRTDGVFASALKSLGTSGVSALEGQRVLGGLLELYYALTERPRSADRFLAVSMDEDEVERTEEVWRGSFTEEAVMQWHLDVRDLVESSASLPQRLRQARSRADEFLKTRGIRTYRGSVELFAAAKLSFLVWLGWEMRYVPRVIALNYFSGTFQRFEQKDRVLFRDRGFFHRLRSEPPLLSPSEPRDPGGHAVLIVDTTGKSTLEQVNALANLARMDGAERRDAYRLFAPPGEVLRPPDLEPILEDVIEMLGHLRRDRGVTHLHLGIAGPSAVAFLLGRQLNAQGMEILLYEFQENQYHLVFTLERNEG